MLEIRKIVSLVSSTHDNHHFLTRKFLLVQNLRNTWVIKVLPEDIPVLKGKAAQNFIENDKKPINKDHQEFLTNRNSIVVVRDDFDAEQYQAWNRDSPDNVLVLDYRQLETFLNGLYKNSTPLKISPEKRRKLEALANCTIYNRDKIKEKFRLGKPLKPDRKLSDFLNNAI